MQPRQIMDPNETTEAVVGIFESTEDASRVAASLRGPNIKLQRVSRNDQSVPDEMPNLVFEDIDKVDSNHISQGIIKGGAIGAGSGLLFLGVPGLNIAAPVVAALAGAWIGGIAGADEANRACKIPKESEYRQMLANGKSFVVIAGDQEKRREWATEMKRLGAIDVHQHPPLDQVVHSVE